MMCGQTIGKGGGWGWEADYRVGCSPALFVRRERKHTYTLMGGSVPRASPHPIHRNTFHVVNIASCCIHHSTSCLSCSIMSITQQRVSTHSISDDLAGVRNQQGHRRVFSALWTSYFLPHLMRYRAWTRIDTFRHSSVCVLG